ncbi:MAG: caspase family protein [Alphaproteobacteria bacterium]|nr:caspase family protein [Alphaproteobacteria bacterium]MCB9796563.1 caspase family protein [Alphaproteobacteria bacterium]
MSCLLALLGLALAAPRFQPQLTHSGIVQDLALSPDGALAASGGADGTVRLWSMDTGAVLQVLAGTGNMPVQDLAWGEGGPVWCDVAGRVFQAELSGAPREAPRPPGHDVCMALALGEHGALVLGFDSLELLDLEAGPLQRARTPGRLGALAASGDRAWTYGDDGVLRAWRLPELEPAQELSLGDPAPAALAVAPDGARVAVALQRESDAVELVLLDRAGQVLERQTHTGRLLSLLWSEAGLRLLTLDGLRIASQPLSPPGPRTLLPLQQGDFPTALAASPGSDTLLVGTVGGAVEAWDLSPEGDPSRPLGRAGERAPRDLEIGGDGRYALSLSHDGGAPLVWSVTDGGVACAASSPREARAMALSGDGRVAVSLDALGVVQRWDPEAGARLGVAAQLSDKVDVIGLSEKGDALVAAAGERLWWLPLGGPTQAYPEPLAQLPGRAVALAVSPDGQRLGVGLRGGGVALLSLPDGALLQHIEEPTGWDVDRVLFSEDGEALVVADDARVRVYASADGARLAEAPVGGLLDARQGALSAAGDRQLTGALRWIAVRPEDLLTELGGVRWSPAELGLTRKEAGRAGLGRTTQPLSKLDLALSGAVLLTPDGRRAFVSGSKASGWVDLESGALLSRWAHAQPAGAVLLGPDSLLTLGRWGELERWSLSSCEVEQRAQLSTQETYDEASAGRILDLDPASGRLVTEWRDTLHVWEAASGAHLRAVPWAHEGSPATARLSQGGRYLLTLGDRGVVQVVDVASGAAKPSWQREGQGRAEGLSVSPDGYRVLIDCSLRAADSGALILRLEGCIRDGGLGVLPDGERAVAELGPTLRVLSLRDGQALSDLPIPVKPARVAVGDPEIVLGDREGWLFATPLQSPTRLRFRSDAGAGSVALVDISEDGSALLSVHADGALRIWDLDEARLKQLWRPEAEDIGAAALLRGGRVVALAYGPPQGHDRVALYDLARGKLLSEHTLPGAASRQLVFAPDGRRYAALDHSDPALVAAQRAWLELRDLDTGALLSRHEVPLGLIALRWSEGGRLLALGPSQLVVIEPDGESARSVDVDGAWLAWFEGERARWIEQLSLHELAPGGAPEALSLRVIQPMPNWVLGPYAVALEGWDLSWAPVSALDAGQPGAALTPVPSHAYAPVGDATPDGRLLVLSGRDGVIRVHRPDTGDAVALLADGVDWIVATDDGWFDASRTGGRLLAVVDGETALPIDRYAATRNRPDLILELLGSGDPALIEHLRAVALQRLAGLGAPAEAFGEAPSLSLIEARVEGAEGVLRWSVRPGDAALGALTLRADGVTVARPALTEPEGELRLPLLPGPNHLELLAQDTAGVTSLPARVTLAGPPAPPGRLLVFTMGVSDYTDDRLDLAFAAKDARDLAEALSGVEGYAEVITRTWTDAEVTPEAFDALEALLRETRPEDSVVLFFAGHGTWSRGREPQYYYLPHGVKLRDIEGSAVPFERLEALLEPAPARRRLLLLDTCESGRRDPDAGPPPELPEGASARAAPALERGGRARRVGPPGGKPDRGRFIYHDIARGTGAVVFSSSRGDERSYERADLRNGVFTEHLLEGLAPEVADADRDGSLSFLELSAYVSASVAETTDGLQHPSVDWDNPEGRVELSVVPGVQALIEADQR